MKMSDDDVKNYKDLALWLQEFPDLPRRKPKVWKAFVKHVGGWWNPWVGGLTLANGTPWVLTWGFSPTISPRTPTSSPSWACKKDGEPERKESRNRSGEVIGDYFVQRYDSKRLGYTAKDGSIILIASDLARGAFYPEVEKVLEATILHELVHWCRFAIGKDVSDEGPPYAFEKEAYGHVMERTWEVCFDEEFYVVEPSKGK
jgi:Metallopeptidase toxin 3